MDSRPYPQSNGNRRAGRNRSSQFQNTVINYLNLNSIGL